MAVLLGVVGATSGTASRRLRAGLGAGVVVSTVLALGTTLAGGRFTYLLLHRYGPGWQGIRTPGRLIVLSLLGLGLLAALGADRLLGRRDRHAGWRVVAVAVLLTLAVVEGAGRIPVVEVPRPASAAAVASAAPQLHLPTSISQDQVFMVWSTAAGFPSIVNGSSGFEPAFLASLRERVASFPDAGSVAALRAVGVRTVVLHLDMVGGTPWERAAGRPVAGLGIGRRQEGDVVVYDLGPAGEPTS